MLIAAIAVISSARTGSIAKRRILHIMILLVRRPARVRVNCAGNVHGKQTGAEPSSNRRGLANKPEREKMPARPKGYSHITVDIREVIKRD
jgi:hypothetical protein